MDKYLVLDINIFAIIILCFLLYYFKSSHKFSSLSDKMFILVIVSNIILLLSDIISTSLSGIEGDLVRFIVVTSKFLFFLSCILLCVGWLYYNIIRVNYLNKLKGILIKYIIPAPFVLFLMFMAATLNQNLVFGYTDLNQYYRGDYFHLSTFVGYIYIVASLIFIIIKRKHLNKGDFINLILLPSVAMVLGFLQSFIKFPMLFVWPALAIVLNGVGLNTLIIKSSTDYLTGLNNRSELDAYLYKSAIECINKNLSLSIMIMDIDSFKMINDTFGHVEGDNAIKVTSDIIKKSLKGKGLISRYGGDEFAVVISDCNKEDISMTANSIKLNLDEFNSKDILDYNISLSIGFDTFYGDQLLDISKMLKQVDKKMYQQKTLI